MSKLSSDLPGEAPDRPIMVAGSNCGWEFMDECGEGEGQLDKSFGYPKNLTSKYELGKEVGRGHFGHTCWAKGKKGELKNQPVAVKIISKAKVCGMCMHMLLFFTHS